MKRSKKLKYDHITLLAEGDAEDQSMAGTMFYKQIAKFGKWVNPLYPIEFMELDREWAQTIVDNFNAGIIDRVPVPLDHTDATEANTGEVVKLEIKDDGLYAYLDIRRPNVVEDINNGLIFDVSISFDWDYIDTADGKHHGPTLLHVALVNNPYLKGMPAFQEAVDVAFSKVAEKMTAALSLPKSSSVIMLSESKIKELSMNVAKVKNDKDFPVEIAVKNEDGEEVKKTLQPGEETEVPKEQAEGVLTTIAEATDPEGEGSGEGEGEGEGSGSEGEGEGEGGEGSGEGEGSEQLSEAERKELEDLRQKTALSEVEKSYQTLLSAGKITPAQKEAFMRLSEVHTTKVELSGKQVSLSKIVTDILEAGPKRVNFSEEGSGKNGEGEGEGAGSGAGTEDKKPSETLSEEERKGMQATGADPKRMDELAGKYPAMASALASDNKSEGES